MAFFQDTDSDDSVLADINVTPLVDVMLVLLIIFMIATPMLHQGVEVTLPEMESPASLAIRDEDPLILTIAQNDLVYIRDEPVATALLVERLLPMLELRDYEAVFVKGDEEVPYGRIINVLDVLERADIHRVSLVVEPAD
ncbi:MAG: biopolymer transporter ExbD [Holophagales bacterium]|nr:biopolymer transporter ExbD [Holophagales bacterium]MXX60831.1 biopolymer transporter ExbD [Holophagales bacterium]MXX77329.1 biopolymer transporter ExbD [Holophagales bacterium]MYA08105.1 biopolymer transporter ExbD [Holophagales bacterium]MYC10252.1 biopolymer transporter ExbD [Holophagales bacterium]